MDDEGKLVDREPLQKAYDEWRHLIELLFDLENNIITVTVADYTTMPAIVLDAWRIFRSELNEYREKHNKRRTN